MDVSPNITRTLKVAAYICLPISGVLAGIAGVFLWLSLTETMPQERTPVASRQEANPPLNIIQTNALYLNSFKSAALYETYENAQGLLYARTYDDASFEATRAVPKKPLLAQIADSMRIVPEAQAGTPASADAKADAKSGKKGDKKAGTTAPKGPMSAKPALAAQAAPAPAPASVAAPVQPANSPAAPAPAARATAQAGTNSDENAFPETFKAGTLGQLTQLRAELEQLKMQVTIEETRSKLNQLRGKPSSPSNMPSLDFPPIGMPSGAGNASVRILSIQSVNGKYTATVGTSQGPKIVSANDSINGNRVVSITRNSVVINRGQGNETLTIQE